MDTDCAAGRITFDPADRMAAPCDSVQRVLSLPDATRLFICHDCGPNGRAVRWETSVAEERTDSVHAGQGRTREELPA